MGMHREKTQKRVNLQSYVSHFSPDLEYQLGEYLASSYYSCLYHVRLNLMQRTLEPSIKENVLTEACSCSSKTNEKQVNRKIHLQAISLSSIR